MNLFISQFSFTIASQIISKFQMQKRISNRVKQTQLQTKFLEDQTKKMEEKLSELKKQVQQQKRIKSQMNFQKTVTRWKKATNANSGTAPLKDYAKKILEQQNQAYKKFGVNKNKVTGTKSFQPVLSKLKEQKQEKQAKDVTKIPKLLNQSPNQTLPLESIHNNFWKAKIDTTNLIKQKTLAQFLEENFILEYLQIFQSAEILYLDDLRYVTKQKLQQLGVKPGHQIKILKKAKEQFHKNKQQMPQQSKQTSKVIVQHGYGDGNVQDYDLLRQQQQMAKNEQIFNDIGQNESQQNSQNQQEQYQEQQYDKIQFITNPLSQISLQTTQQYHSINSAQTQPCYQCLKKTYRAITSTDNRIFCSTQCYNKYISKMQKTCPQCGTIFFKLDGFHQQGLWFCSIGCCPNQQEIQELFINWNKK